MTKLSYDESKHCGSIHACVPMLPGHILVDLGTFLKVARVPMVGDSILVTQVFEYCDAENINRTTTMQEK